MLNTELQTSQFATRHQACDLERMFERVFFVAYSTRLCGGGVEPEYLPADNAASVNRLVYREDFFASALHEIAHWCIAGDVRRQQLDFGYWYEAEGRDATKQEAFFKVEIKPQALELLFSLSANFQFKVSVDNAGLAIDARPFTIAVEQQAMQYCEEGMPSRAWHFCQMLGRHYQPELLGKQLLPHLIRQLSKRSMLQLGKQAVQHSSQ